VDNGRFDGLARALASSRTRRGYIAAALGFLGVSALAVRGTTDVTDAAQFCRGEEEPCALTSYCCSGFTCVRTSRFNPNVGVCRRGSVTPTPSSRTPTPRPTGTPSPSPSPTPTPRPGSVIEIPMTIALDCSPAPFDQSIRFVGHFSRRHRFDINIISFRSFRGLHEGPKQGPMITRRNRRATYVWQCPDGFVDPNCRRFFDNTVADPDGAHFHIRYARLDCDATVMCNPGRNPNQILRCIRRS
jgi:hypothetical protein